MRQSARQSLRAPLALATALLCLTAVSGPAAGLTFVPVGRIIGFKIELLGRDLNGQDLNGEVLAGRRLAWVELGGAELAGQPLPSVWLEGPRLFAEDLRGKGLQPRQLVGTTLQGRLEDGGALPLRIDALLQPEQREPEQRGLYTYLVSYATQEGWTPLCGRDEDGEPVPAFALEGRWDLREGVEGGGDHLFDPDVFTFACDSYVLAKCVRAGYAPWREAKACIKGQGCERLSLADHHQACTRMLRADYCGDGRSQTLDDTLVSFFDGFGIRLDSEDWPPEAEWDAAGAVCVDHERVVLGDVPDCWQAKLRPACGDPSHFATGSLLISETGPMP